MDYKVKVCNNCHKNNKRNWIYTSGFDVDADKVNRTKCITCGNQLETTILTVDEYSVLESISHDVNFFDAMIELKEKDIIEYNLKMSQFRSQVEQKKQAEENSVPKCPHCNSTNIKSLSGLNRGASIAMFGIFSKKINKSFECKNCGYTW